MSRYRRAEYNIHECTTTIGVVLPRWCACVCARARFSSSDNSREKRHYCVSVARGRRTPIIPTVAVTTCAANVFRTRKYDLRRRVFGFVKTSPPRSGNSPAKRLYVLSRARACVCDYESEKDTTIFSKRTSN